MQPGNDEKTDRTGKADVGEVHSPEGLESLAKIQMPKDKIFRVSSTANVSDLAWSVAKALEEGFRPILVGIGVQAVSQAVKAVAVANSRVASQGKVFSVLPAFENLMIDDPEQPGSKKERTVIKLVLIPYRF